MKTKFLALAALVLGLASCQQEFNGVTPVEGEVDFQLGVSAPELVTRADDGDQQYGLNSAFGAIDYLGDTEDLFRTDWTDVDLRYSLEVYDKADNYAGATPVKDRQVIIVDKYEPVTFNLRLIPNREYHFVVFADFVEQGASNNPAIDVQDNLGLHHTIGATLQDITINDDAINDECTDAYFGTRDLTISNSAANGMELKRPYAKVRVIATDLDQLNINVEPKSVEVKYYAKHPQTFNAVTGVIGAEETEVKYTLTSEYNDGVCKESLANHFYTEGYDKETVTNANNVTRHTHMTLFTDYILATDQQDAIHFDMTVKEANGETIKFTEFSTDIPVQRNHLTTIIGNVLTTATEVNVTIDDNFEGEYIVYTEDYVIDESTNTLHAYNVDGLLKWSWLVAHRNQTLSVKLESNITFPMYTVEEDTTNETYKYTTTPITITDGVPSGSNWVQVGTYSPYHVYFDAKIDGNNKVLSDLTMYTENAVSGFIGYCENVEVCDLTFDNATLYSTSSYVSPLSYMLDGSYIHNVHTKNSYIRGTSYVAGIAAEAMDHYDDPDKTYVHEFMDGTRQKLMPLVTLENCTTDSNTTIVGTSTRIGGIVGQNYGAMIINCHNKANISGNGEVGGIAGHFRDYFNGQYGYIVNCTSTDCNIQSSGARVGGIAGYILEGHDGSAWIVGCYSNSTIECTKSYIGSIVGYLNGTNKILGNYAISTRNVSGYGSAGNFSFSFANEADITAEAIAKMNEGIDEYNAFAASYTFPTTPVSAKPMVLPTATAW